MATTSREATGIVHTKVQIMHLWPRGWTHTRIHICMKVISRNQVHAAHTHTRWHVPGLKKTLKHITSTENSLNLSYCGKDFNSSIIILQTGAYACVYNYKLTDSLQSEQNLRQIGYTIMIYKEYF